MLETQHPLVQQAAHLADRLQGGEAELEVRRGRVVQLTIHAVEQLKDALQQHPVQAKGGCGRGNPAALPS